jgi:hypothetical protein
MQYEQALLGAILQHAECKYLIYELKADYFSDDNNRKVFLAMLALHNANEPIEIFTVKNKVEELNSIDWLKYSDLLAYVDLLAGVADLRHNVRFTIKKIITAYKLKEETRISDEIKFHSSDLVKVQQLIQQLNELNKLIALDEIKLLGKNKESQAQFCLQDILPSPLYAYLYGISSVPYKDFPVEAAFTLFLSIVGSLAGTKFTVSHRRHKEHAFWWSIVGLPVGSGKTPILNNLMKPLTVLQYEALEVYKQELKEFQESKKKRKKDTSLEEFQEELPEPKRKRFYLSDSTMETTLKAHADNPNGLLWVKDELKGLFNSLGAYKGGRGEDKETLLSLGAGTFISVARKETDIELVKSAISLTGGIQPQVLKDLYSKDGDKDNGLWQRFSYIIYETVSREKNPDDVVLNDSILTKLYSHIISSEGASLVFADYDYVEWVSDYFNEEIDKAPTMDMQAYYTKCFGFFLRLSLLLHILDSHFAYLPYDKPISRTTSENAFSLIVAYISHAEKLFCMKAIKSKDQQFINKILDKSLAKRTINEIAKTITQRVDKPSDYARYLFELMQEAGLGTINKTNGKNWQFVLKGETTA